MLPLVASRPDPCGGVRGCSVSQPKTTLFDRPLWKDWCAWLGLVAIAAGLSKDFGSDPALDAVAAVLTVGFQWALFACVPAVIRRAVRERRNPTVRSTSGGWQPANYKQWSGTAPVVPAPRPPAQAHSGAERDRTGIADESGEVLW